MKQLWQVFTDDFEHSIMSGLSPVAIHHIFGKSERKLSEKYGFLIPLTPHEHNMGGQKCIHQNKDFDLYWKRKAQEYYEEHYGTRDDFRKEFGKSYL